MSFGTNIFSALPIDAVDAPLALCTNDGCVQEATSQTILLLGRVGVEVEVPFSLPETLWAQLQLVPTGEAIQWRPPNRETVLGCTRYPAANGFLIFMKEISKIHAALSRRLYRQQLESTGRLAASIAHELRNAITAIAYCADFLHIAGPDLDAIAVQDTAREVLESGRRIQFTVDTLLDYARLEPKVATSVSLSTVLNRAERFVRVVYSGSTHTISIDIESAAQYVVGNALAIEQIFVNLILNAIENTEGIAQVELTASLGKPTWSNDCESPPLVRIQVKDSGPGIPKELRKMIFEPFFTTHDQGMGLGLPIAREAAEAIGGALILDESCTVGTCFSVYFASSRTTNDSHPTS